MNVIDKFLDDDRFLKEDMLITKPSLFVYVPKEDADNIASIGIRLTDGKISSYLTRLPEKNDTYAEFLNSHFPVRISISKLFKIKDQKIKLLPVNITMVKDETIKNSNAITDLVKKYTDYLNICYQDNIPLDDIPHIDICASNSCLPGFVLKVLKNNSNEIE